jgi:uncharacterized membrane protein YdjX (TVP38/TMEM64 family)
MNKKPLIFISILVLIGLAIWQLPIAAWLEHALTWIEANKQTAWIVFAIAYIAAIVLLLPASVFSLAAGYLFGVLQGWVLVVVTATIGATLSFLVGRSLLREWVVKRARDMANFSNLDEAVSKKGFLIVLLTRLSPAFPFSMINYVYGITKISVKDYTLATLVGIIPGGLLYVYIGSTMKNLQDVLSGNIEQSAAQQWLLYGGLLATLILTILITRIAKNALSEAAHLDNSTNTDEQNELNKGNK